MTIQFCRSCQSNNVNTRVEWRPNPDKPGKNKQFDIDKNEWHTCPFWKPDPNYKKKQMANIPPDVKEAFTKIEDELKVNDLEKLIKIVESTDEKVNAILVFLQNKMGWEKASDTK